MGKATEKQLKYLSTFIDITKFEKINFSFEKVYNLIELYKSLPMLLRPYVEIKSNCDYRDVGKNLEKYINSHLGDYDLCGDEHAALYKVMLFKYEDKENVLFVYQQTWFKGMAESALHKTICVDKFGVKMNAREALLSVGVDSLYDLLIYLRDNDFNLEL